MRETELGQMIRHARKAAGLRLEDVAELVGVTAGALSHIESGRRLPTPQNAVLIAEVLGIPAEELLLVLDHEHSSRRRGTVNSWRAGGGSEPDTAGVYSKLPIESLFSGPASRPSAAPQPPQHPSARPMTRATIPADEYAPRSASSAARSAARWSDDAAVRMEALDELASTASEAIRTLRGLLGDDDPAVAHEAARLLRELDVRNPDE